MTGWPLCADNKLTCSPVLEEVTLIFLRLKVGQSSELWKEGSFGLSMSSSGMAMDLGALLWSDGGGVHKSMIMGAIAIAPGGSVNPSPLDFPRSRRVPCARVAISKAAALP